MNRKPLSSAEINRMQDFNAVLKGAAGGGANGGTGSGGFSSWLYIAGASLLVVGALVTWTLIPSNKEEAIQRQVEQNIPETMPRTQEDSEDTVRAPLVRLPVKEWDMAFSSHTLNAQKGGEIKLPSGTIIRIPGSCVVNENNDLVKGEVEYRFREFIDPIDIALSGISMEYDSAGTKYYFETAGMTELRAFQNNKELKMAPGKQIAITLKNEVKGKYTLYQLDEAKGWQARGTTTSILTTPSGDPMNAPGSNFIIVEPVDEQSETLTIQPIAIEVQKLGQEIEKLVAQKPKAPQKANITRPRFNLEVDLKDFPELSSFEKMQFEVAPEDKTFTPEHYKVNWNNVQLKRYSDRRYKMVLTKVATKGSPKQEIELIVIPVIAEQDYEAAKKQYDNLLADYDQKLGQKKAEEIRLKKKAEEEAKALEEVRKDQERIQKDVYKMQAELTRSFSINGFGIWNCDNPRLRPDRKENCLFVDSNGQPLNVITAYCVMTKDKGLIYMHNSGQTYNVLISEGRNEIILLLLEGNKIAVKKAEEIKPIDGKQVMIPLTKTFTDGKEIKNYVYQAIR